MRSRKGGEPPVSAGEVLDVDAETGAPEAYRLRAQSGANLAMTAAAAIGAALVFGAETDLPYVGSILAFASLTALLVSVTAYAAAGQYARQRTVPVSKIHAEAREITQSIARRIKIASVAGVVAIAALTLLGAVIVFSHPNRVDVIVHVNATTARAARQACPALPNDVIAGSLSEDDLRSDLGYLNLAVPRSTCGADIEAIRLDRADVTLIIEDDGS